MIQLSIMSAEAKRIESAFYAEQRRIEQEKYKAERPMRVEKLVEKIFNLAKKEIEESKFDCCEIYLEYSKLGSDDNDEICEAYEIVRDLLEKAGYTKNWFYKFSIRQQIRSESYGYWRISW